MLALRGTYINVYYRGGSLLRITERHSRFPALQSTYDVGFDENFGRVDFPTRVGDDGQVKQLIGAIPNLKHAMDRFFSEHGRSEREFQQLVVRENNLSSVANETEYFIVDIELAGQVDIGSAGNAKFDMLAVRWRNRERATRAALVPALIEMKYGNSALDGDSGLIKHLKDAYLLRKNKEGWGNLRTGLERHLKQLRDLDLLRFNPSDRVPELLLHPTRTPELIFLLANYNPRARKILDILPKFNTILNEEDPQERLFDVRFFQASFAGYGMHHVSMLSLTDFWAEASRLHNLARRAGDQGALRA